MLWILRELRELRELILFGSILRRWLNVLRSRIRWLNVLRRRLNVLRMWLNVLRMWLNVLRSRIRRLNVLRRRLNVLRRWLNVLRSRLNVLRSRLNVLRRRLNVLRFVIMRIETRWFNNGCASWSSKRNGRNGVCCVSGVSGFGFRHFYIDIYRIIYLYNFFITIGICSSSPILLLSA
jgi:hypothetical protein